MVLSVFPPPSGLFPASSPHRGLDRGRQAQLQAPEPLQGLTLASAFCVTSRILATQSLSSSWLSVATSRDWDGWVICWEWMVKTNGLELLPSLEITTRTPEGGLYWKRPPMPDSSVEHAGDCVLGGGGRELAQGTILEKSPFRKERQARLRKPSLCAAENPSPESQSNRALPSYCVCV